MGSKYSKSKPDAPIEGLKSPQWISELPASEFGTRVPLEGSIRVTIRDLKGYYDNVGA